MQTIKAIYDGITFKLLQPVPVKENYEVFITFVGPIKKETVRRPFEYDSMSGKVWMADDFNEPLDDFREYME